MRTWLRFVRLPNALTAAADVLIGATLAGVPLFETPLVFVMALSSMALYAGGIALNDLCDLEKDRELHPDRALPRGAIAPRHALVVAAALLGLGVLPSLLVPQLGGAAASSEAPTLHRAVTALLVAGILAYDLLPERLAPLGAWIMGAVRALSIARGLTLGEELPELPIALGVPLAHFALILVVTLVSTLENRPFEPGRLRLHAAPLGLIYLFPAALGLLAPPAEGVTWSGVLMAAGLGAWLAGMVSFPAYQLPPRPGLVVFRAIFTLVLFDALYAIATGHWIEAAVVAALLPLMRWLKKVIAQEGS